MHVRTQRLHSNRPVPAKVLLNVCIVVRPVAGDSNRVKDGVDRKGNVHNSAMALLA